MSKKANFRLIGIFVIVGLGLLVAAIVGFGFRDAFKTKERYVSFFQGSVRGLSVGAPVSWRGIDIGQVSEVYGLIANDSLDVEIAVVFEIDPFKIQDPGRHALRWDGIAYEERAKILVDKGVRARLETASILTGQRFVDLNIYPGEPSTMRGIDVGYPEIPTVPSELEEIQENIRETLKGIAELPIDSVITAIQDGLQSVNDFIESENVHETSKNLADATHSLKELVDRMDARAEFLAEDISATSDSARAALSQVRQTVQRLDQAASGSHEMGYRVSTTLDEVAEAARAIKFLAEYLEQHPEALLRGKEEAKQ